MPPRIAYLATDRGAEGFIRAFLAEWLSRLLSSYGAPLTAEDRILIADAIDANFAGDPGHRRLRYLRELFRGQRRPSAGDLAARLGQWCDGGEHAWLFDNEDDALDVSSRILGFDMTRLLNSPTTRTPAMMYLFHRIEQRLDGTPAIIVVDEGGKEVYAVFFVQKTKEGKKTTRKRTGRVAFGPKNADGPRESRAGPAIIEQ